MQMLPTYNFKWVEDTSQFKELQGKSEVCYILQVDAKYLEKI